MDTADDAPASDAGGHAMRAILPGRPCPTRQAISTAHWDGRRLVAYISGNAAIVATGPKHILQTLYINTETSLNAIAIEESSGRIAVCGGTNVYVYCPVSVGIESNGNDADADADADADVLLSWTQSHHLKHVYAVTSLSWGSPAELVVGGAKLVLWHLDEEERVIWSQDIASPTALALFSHDGGLLASCGPHDRMVKIWRRLSYEIDSTRFDVSYLAHPTSVTNLHWRKPWHSEMNLDSLLYTFCADNKIRAWAYVDPHMVSIMQPLAEIDTISTIQPRRLSVGSTTSRRYAFIIDSKDFSNATEKAVSTAAPGVTDHALEHLIEVANRSPELCVVLDGLGHMSVWGLENAGCRNKNATEVFNIAHVEDVNISIFQAEEAHLQDYTQFEVFAGQDSTLSLLVHSYNGTISWYETSVTQLLDTAPRKDRVRQSASWAGHHHPIKGVVKSQSGDLICSWTDVEVLVWRLTGSNVLQQVHSSSCEQVSDALFWGDDLVVLDKCHVHRYGHKKPRVSVPIPGRCTSPRRLLKYGESIAVVAENAIITLPGREPVTVTPPDIGTVYPCVSDGWFAAVALSPDGRLSGLCSDRPDLLAAGLSTSTNVPNSSVLSASSLGKVALADEKKDSLSIWDLHQGTCEWTMAFNDTIEQLSWHKTTRDSHILVVCFAFRILLFAQSRFTLSSDSPPWARVREIRVRDFTSHGIGAVCLLDDASTVVGAGNQVFVLDPPTSKSDRPSPSTPSGLDLANSALPVYSPEVLHALLLLGDFESVDRILFALQEQLKFYTEGDFISSTLNLDLESLLLNDDSTVSAQALPNGVNGNITNGHLSLRAIAERLKESIGQHQIPHLSSAAHSLLSQTIDVAVKLEAHQSSLDEHALRYLHALYTRGSDVDLPWSAIVSASLSDCQEPLLGLVVEFHGGKLTWEAARHSGLFLWLSDVEALRVQMENIARAEYTKQEDRDPVDCSLYYLALGKKHVLQLLWRQSIGVKERELTMKLLANDFNEPRWKATALKNAFALLSKRRFKYGAAFFLLGGSLKDAVHTCVSQVKDLQLAVAISRVYDSPDSRTVLADLIENTVLPAAVDSEQARWMATWAFQLLERPEKAVQVLVRPVHECVGRLDTFGGIQASLSWKANEPLLAVHYVHLRDRLVRQNRWKGVIGAGEESDFVLRAARVYSRMGIDMLALRLVKNWPFENETAAAAAAAAAADVDEENALSIRPARFDQSGQGVAVEEKNGTEKVNNTKKPPPTQFVEPSADSLLDSFGF